MPKLPPQTLDDRKIATAQAYVRAWNDWEKVSRQYGALSRESTSAFRHLKHCEREYNKVRLK